MSEIHRPMKIIRAIDARVRALFRVVVDPMLENSFGFVEEINKSPLGERSMLNLARDL